MVSIFNSEASGYKLWNSVIIDLRASIHVCNDREHFKTLWPTGQEDTLYAGNIFIPIESYEIATITIAMLKGLREIELLETIYILSFYTIVASLKKFMLKDIHLDMKHNQLTVTRNKSELFSENTRKHIKTHPTPIAQDDTSAL